jgi:lipopolysaccharide/colanic/teichoic acid biosynthesis glycosyltransferase
MYKDAEKMTGPVLATEGDPRVTPVGRLLRATRVDELPQLLNVLYGNKSVIGPRPERPVFCSEYEKSIPYYTSRQLVKPGITGLAQVKGRYWTNAQDKLRYDLMYIRNYSVQQDIQILLQTVSVALVPEKALRAAATDSTGAVLTAVSNDSPVAGTER